MKPIPIGVIESAMYGIIDGLSSFLTSSVCTGGMANIIDSSFRMIDNIQVYDPRYIMKFTMATNNLTDAINIVSAYCSWN